MTSLEKQAAEILAHIMANRERYLAAWIAETGRLPSECQIVERRNPDGSVTVTVEAKT